MNVDASPRDPRRRGAFTGGDVAASDRCAPARPARGRPALADRRTGAVRTARPGEPGRRAADGRTPPGRRLRYRAAAARCRGHHGPGRRVSRRGFARGAAGARRYRATSRPPPGSRCTASLRRRWPMWSSTRRAPARTSCSILDAEARLRVHNPLSASGPSDGGPVWAGRDARTGDVAGRLAARRTG